MENGILAEITEFNIITNYDWNEFTTIYNKFGYYMMFNKGKMVVMLRQADMSEEQREAAGDYIKKNVDMNKCKVLF